MGNAAIFYPGDEPTPCWTCRHLVALNTRWSGTWPEGQLLCTLHCARRGRYCFTDPDVGCRYHEPNEKSPAPV